MLLLEMFFEHIDKRNVVNIIMIHVVVFLINILVTLINLVIFFRELAQKPLHLSRGFCFIGCCGNN
jgi:hypothetical protein